MLKKSSTASSDNIPQSNNGHIMFSSPNTKTETILSHISTLLGNSRTSLSILRNSIDTGCVATNSEFIRKIVAEVYKIENSINSAAHTSSRHSDRYLRDPPRITALRNILTPILKRAINDTRALQYSLSLLSDIPGSTDVLRHVFLPLSNVTCAVHKTLQKYALLLNEDPVLLEISYKFECFVPKCLDYLGEVVEEEAADVIHKINCLPSCTDVARLLSKWHRHTTADQGNFPNVAKSHLVIRIKEPGSSNTNMPLLTTPSENSPRSTIIGSVTVDMDTGGCSFREREKGSLNHGPRKNLKSCHTIKETPIADMSVPRDLNRNFLAPQILPLSTTTMSRCGDRRSGTQQRDQQTSIPRKQAKDDKQHTRPATTLCTPNSTEHAGESSKQL